MLVYVIFIISLIDSERVSSILPLSRIWQERLPYLQPHLLLLLNF